MTRDQFVSEVATEHNQLATLPLFGDKAAVGKLAGGMSKRWVCGEMQKGMPHLRLGSRRVRFNLVEVAKWLEQQYRVQRRASR